MSLTARAMALAARQNLGAVAGDVEGVKNTFSSWDSCMSKAYCKWPVIVGIIIGSLIVISVIACLARICFCGAECCFCCAGCAKCLCGGGRKRDPGYDQRVKNGGYARPPENTGYAGYAAQGPYQSHAPPTYGKQTATFDAPSKGAALNADSLPHMPSWSDATSHHVEDHSTPVEEEVEMDKLNNTGQTEPMLPKIESDDAVLRGDSAHNLTGDLGLGSAAMGAGAMAANPYHDGYGRSASGTPVSPNRRTSGQYGQAISSDPYRQQPYGQAQTSPSRQQYGSSPYGYDTQTSPSRLPAQQPQNPYDASSTYSRTSPPSYATNAPAPYPSSRPQQPRLQTSGTYAPQRNASPSYRNASPSYSRPMQQSPVYQNQSYGQSQSYNQERSAYNQGQYQTQSPTSPVGPYAPAPAASAYQRTQSPAYPGQTSYQAPRQPSSGWRDV